jgi:hypothetical protein
VDDLIAHLEPGEMTAWVRKAQIADVHGQATRLPNEHREGSLQDDPKARAGVTTKPSPARATTVPRG